MLFKLLFACVTFLWAWVTLERNVFMEQIPTVAPYCIYSYAPYVDGLQIIAWQLSVFFPLKLSNHHDPNVSFRAESNLCLQTSRNIWIWNLFIRHCVDFVQFCSIEFHPRHILQNDSCCTIYRSLLVKYKERQELLKFWHWRKMWKKTHLIIFVVVELNDIIIILHNYKTNCSNKIFSPWNY